jgi:hypothetical protein
MVLSNPKDQIALVLVLLVATINEMNNPTVAVVCIQEVQYPL